MNYKVLTVNVIPAMIIALKRAEVLNLYARAYTCAHA